MDHSPTDADSGTGKAAPPEPVVIPLHLYPPIIGYDGLSLLLGRAVSTLQADRVRRPDSVPPACTPPGSRNPLWIVADVVDWLRTHTEARHDTHRESPSRGAPRKRERLAASAAGMTVQEWRKFQQEKGGTNGGQ